MWQRRKVEQRWSGKPKRPKERGFAVSRMRVGMFFSSRQDPSEDFEPLLYIDAKEKHGVVWINEVQRSKFARSMTTPKAGSHARQRHKRKPKGKGQMAKGKCEKQA